MAFRDKNIKLVLSNYDIGAGKKGASGGPAALLEELKLLGIQFEDFKILNPNGQTSNNNHYKHSKNIDEIASAALTLNNEVLTMASNGLIPLIFSGDHSNAIGGVSGLKNANPGKRIGVIWIDAHADLHSPYTTPSGNMHGMPLAALLSHDNLRLKKNEVSENEVNAWNALKKLGHEQINPKIKSSDLVFIGIRDAEPEEWDLINELKIRTFEPDDIKEHGIYYAINKALMHLSACDLIYVSFDVDSIDPSISTGTGTPAPDGLKLIEAAAVFETLLNIPNLGAFEITEINPGLDNGGEKMAKVIAGIFKSAYNKK